MLTQEQLESYIQHLDIDPDAKHELSKLFQRQKNRIKGLEFMNARMQKDKDISVNMLRNTIVELNEKNKLIQEQLIILESSYQELEQFSYVASHDLKSPLRTIGNFSQLLQKRYAGKLDESANEFLDYIVSGTKRMDLVINDLLSFSRIGRKDAVFEWVPIADVLQNVLDNLFAEIQQNNATIQVDAMPSLYVNRSGILQLFQNLISNAIKFRKEQVAPVIQVSIKEESDRFVFQVIDNGVGLDVKYKDKAFKPFQRVNNTDRPGSGIGLAICKKVIQLHQGGISVDSISGVGTTFTFHFPKTFVHPE